jgi:type I protein arginine methyltransferase
MLNKNLFEGKVGATTIDAHLMIK